jgi:hypothetical protein
MLHEVEESCEATCEGVRIEVALVTMRASQGFIRLNLNLPPFREIVDFVRPWQSFHGALAGVCSRLPYAHFARSGLSAL